MKVLVAEDDPTTRHMLSILLRRKDINYGLAEDGFHAVQAWETGEYDVIFMDVQMPRMNGIQATREIREREGDKQVHVAIIAMTAHLMPEDVEDCYSAGMDDVIAKPLDFKKLLCFVERYRNGLC